MSQILDSGLVRAAGFACFSISFSFSQMSKFVNEIALLEQESNNCGQET